MGFLVRFTWMSAAVVLQVGPTTAALHATRSGHVASARSVHRGARRDSARHVSSREFCFLHIVVVSRHDFVFSSCPIGVQTISIENLLRNKNIFAEIYKLWENFVSSHYRTISVKVKATFMSVWIAGEFYGAAAFVLGERRGTLEQHPGHGLFQRQV